MSTRPATPRARLRRLAVRSATFALLLGIGSASSGCAAGPVPPPIVSTAELGSVIIYRNGVAYFERYLPPGETELTLRVPFERVDDFLKSLTIIDQKTGETMPMSYPTIDRDGGEVDMTIELPKRHNGLRISYVTESPAWKPSYRLVLGEAGKGKLQGWAVVDNVSGEDWRQVRVGVGSTSALSFRYDLHSIRLVERETLSSGSLLAVAPPTGGSPYDSGEAAKKVVVAGLGQGELAALEPMDGMDGKPADIPDTTRARTAVAKAPPQERMGATAGGRSTGYGSGYGKSVNGGAAPPASRPAQDPWKDDELSYYRQPAKPVSRAQQMVFELSNRLRANKQEKVRIEGFAKNGDKSPRTASLDRANILRERLLEQGVDPNQVEAVGTGELNEAEGLRVVAVADPAGAKGGEAKTDPAVEAAQPLGQAHFLSSEAMTIERDHSALVSIISAEAEAERVYFYDPISARGSDNFAFNAVRLKNPSEYTLDSGPFTVYLEGQFLGEGLAEPILPHSQAFIPYALDRNIIVEPEVGGREEIERLVTIQRGIVSTESRQIRSTKLALVNRGTEDATVYVRHQVAPGYQLSTLGPEIAAPEKLGGAHLFRVQAKAGSTTELTIDEWTPVERTVDIRSDAGVEALGVYLKRAKLGRELQLALDEIVRRHTGRANLLEQIQTLEEQMQVYRTRVDELNVQLVTLRKLPQGAKLRAHLSDKMDEISDKLQETTMELADLKGQLMTASIELQDRVAELSLRKERDETKSDELAKKE